MSKMLITHSLHSSWHFYNALESKEKSDFLNTLNKVRETDNENMAAGRKFEDDVYKSTLGQPYDASDAEYANCVKSVVGIVKGGLWQEPVYKEIKLSGIDCLLYGRADVIKKDWIYDIKRTRLYEIGKFKKSVQHKLYMYCTNIDRFGYLICDGHEMWREDYFMTESTVPEMQGELSNMVEYIMSDDDFRRAFLENWKAK